MCAREIFLNDNFARLARLHNQNEVFRKMRLEQDKRIKLDYAASYDMRRYEHNRCK